MNKMWLLTRVLLKNGESSFTFSSKKKSNPLIIYGLLAIIILPVAMLFGIMVSNYYTSLETLNQTGVILALGFMTISVAVFFFGIFYVMNIFYFANDIETLLPLPLKPSEILGAKFATVVLYEYLITAVIYIPIILAYGTKSAAGIMFYVYAIAIFFALPIIPLVFASILVMILMRYTNIAKNKDRMKIIGGILAILLAVGGNYAIQSYTQDSMTLEQVQHLLSEENALIKFITNYFPTSVFPTEALVQSSNFSGLLNALIFFVLSFVVLLLFLALGEKIYFKGVFGVSETSAKRKSYSAQELTTLTKEKSPLFSLLLNELKVLIRTPAYFLNCILSSLLIPFILVLALFVDSDTTMLTMMISTIFENDYNAGLVFSIVLIISIFLGSTNSVAATAVSREGKNIFINKFLPIPYITQLWAKLLSGVIVSLLTIVALVLIEIFMIKLPADFIVLSSIIMLLGVLLSSFVGILFDCYSPRLDWVNEQKAIKGNINSIISMLISLLLGGGITLLFLQFQTNLWTGFLGVAAVLVVLNGIGAVLLQKIGVKWYSSIEA